MKFTNVKQLIIKFMGGGLINFPTRFLRWVKINGDSEDNGSDDGSGGDSTEIDYEAIYQFYKKKIIEKLPEGLIQESIIPEHFIDIENGFGYSEEYENKPGIWKTTKDVTFIENPIILFNDFHGFLSPIIYFGQYKYQGDTPE